MARDDLPLACVEGCRRKSGRDQGQGRGQEAKMIKCWVVSTLGTSTVQLRRADITGIFKKKDKKIHHKSIVSEGSID